jgi:chaperonin GroES
VTAVAELLRPLFDRVVIQELKQEAQMRQSGLMVPPTTLEASMPPHHGIVLAVGPGLDWWEGAGIEMPVKPGDHVVFPYSAGSYVEMGEERLLVLRVIEILGVVDEPARRNRGISSGDTRTFPG